MSVENFMAIQLVDAEMPGPEQMNDYYFMVWRTKRISNNNLSSGCFYSSSLAHCMNKTITLQYKLHDPCKQMEGHDTAINGCMVDHVAAASHCESSHGRASLQMRPAIL